MNVFNERDLVTLKLSSFKDDQGNLIAPGAISMLWFRVDEIKTGTNQKPQTNVTPADPVYLKFLPTENVMVDAAQPYEICEITYHFEWGPQTGKTKKVLFQRNNLRFFS
jgi:hypothetical protein